MQERRASLKRETAETKIELSVALDGSGQSDIATGIGFFDHMLTLFAKHSLADLTVKADGDLEVDFHHTVEDTGIVLGTAIREALGDKRGIVRYGHCYLPMDETLSRAVVDFSGRPFLDFRAPAGIGSVGAFPFSLVEEFCRAFANNAGANVHIETLYGRDAHHIAESIFKGLARACDAAWRRDPRVSGVPSTKGSL
ncbi:MAG: imidazoleglycerol-phosphate dehydratase HisB [Verrucomicrobiales bacterium]